MDELPFEILNIIFSYLPRNDLFQCQTTCKSWYRPAQRYSYKNIFLKYQAQAEKYIETISSFQELGQFAESIDLDRVFLPQFYAASPDRFKIITQLAELCPNIKYLNTNDTNNGFFKSLLPVYQKGYFRYLENIPVPNGWAVFRDYVQCVLAMREKLTRLTIGDATNRQCYFDDIFQDNFMDEMTNKLDEFTHLKSLSFIKHTDSYIFEFDDIIQKCPQLDSFSFTAYSLKRIASIGMFDYLRDDVDVKVDLQHIQPRPSIRSFKGNFLLMSDETLKYLMFKFPKLQHLEINTNHRDHQLVADLKTRGFGFSTKTMQQFLSVLFRLKTAKLYNLHMPDGVDFMSGMLKTLGFNGVVEIKYKFENHSYISADNPMLHFDADSNHSSCWDANKISAVFEAANQHEKPLVRETEAKIIPHLALIKTSGDYIQHLSFGGINKKLMNHYGDSASCILNSALLGCPLLKSLSMVNCTLLNYQSTSCYTTSPSIMERLSINQCQLEEENLTKISVDIPALKYLDLIDCDYTSNGESHTVCIDMPSTSFEKLVYTDTKAFSFISKVYLQVITNCSRNMYFAIQGNICSCSTLGEYNQSLETNRKDILWLNVCCKDIKTITIDLGISSCMINM